MVMNRQPICVLTTGGTIDKEYFDTLSDYQVGESTVPMMLRIALADIGVRIEGVMRKDSLEVGDADRAQICERVAAAAETLIVITHGTDTMTDTASALATNPAAIAGKTVVLTGALAPARFAESDAAFNLGMALAAVQTCAPGIYIAMSGQVFDALKVRKDRAAGRFVPIG